jgi:hypothetical protein
MDLVSQLVAEQHPDFRASLAELSRLAANQVALPDMLTHVAMFAVRAIPGADGAGLTLLRKGRPETIVTTSDLVQQVDDIQYGIGEGPCITAAEERRTVRSGSLGTERAWPRFGARVSQLGVHSALSLPLVSGDVVVAAINIYAQAHNAFDEHASTLAELFAVPAAVSVQDAQALAQARTVAVQLETALTTRAVIDQALGILMSRTGCTDEQAFDRLRTSSQAKNVKVSVLAQQIVDEAVRRARARHSEPRNRTE